MKKQFHPDAGRYRKIDIYIQTITGTAPCYMHSTKAYATLRQAEIGAALSLERRDRKYFTQLYDSGLFQLAEVNPYTIRAFFSDKE